jgi:hypothetical protein
MIQPADINHAIETSLKAIKRSHILIAKLENEKEKDSEIIMKSHDLVMESFTVLHTTYDDLDKN